MDKTRIMVEIPVEEDFKEGYDHILVPGRVVDSTINMLQGMLAQWTREIGCVPDEGIWAELMTAAGHALGGLVAAHAGEYIETIVAQLVRQIGWALKWQDVDKDLQAVRTAENADIVDALLGLHAERQRRQKEQMRQHRAGRAPQPAPDRAGAITADGTDAAPEEGPARKDEAGWDF
jgi:hypothetical protein